jgi:hypothetical protein
MGNVMGRLSGKGNQGEYPILFSTPMVQSLCIMQKTKTRRVVREGMESIPRYKIGDILWVRESWALLPAASRHGIMLPKTIYKADLTDTELLEMRKTESGGIPPSLCRVHTRGFF